ncbi:MAG: PilW family protein [Candidatus Thiodiazotropha sp. (ex Semelilucina semeliformis)]|nr:PilW family protein [Candidatus Thiodiazotropha sp. (ex Semelilucina semeliformis)]
MKGKNNITYSSGLTLVELMIGLVLSLMILGGAVSIFMSSKESFRLEEDLSILQESFRFIADKINKDISMVGYSGCAMPYVNNTPTVDVYVNGLGVTDVIQGTEGCAGPDSITVSYALPGTGIPVVEGAASRADPLRVTQNSTLYQQLADNFDTSKTPTPQPITVLVGNCDRANIFLVSGVANTTSANFPTAGEIFHWDAYDPGHPDDVDGQAAVSIAGVENSSGELSERYGAIGEETSFVYGVGSVTYEIATVSGVTGLYESRNGGTRQLLFDNVTDMQVLYGIDSPAADDGNADRYVTWSGGLRLSDITSLKILLTMVISQVGTNDVTQDFEFTVKLRNMGLDA